MRYLIGEEWRSKRGNIKYLDSLRQLSRNNRKGMTPSEKVFWNMVKNKKMGYLFLRQKPIQKVIFDFYCSKLLLAVEIDGGYHEKRRLVDRQRDLLVKQMGIKTLRIEINLLKDERKVTDWLKIELQNREKELGM